VIADETLRGAGGMTTGANEDEFHLRNVRMDRDILPTKWADLRTAIAGEPCPVCGKPLKIQRAIEVGHVFKLGTKYSIALEANFLGEDGKQMPIVMGSYGIGISRTMQAVIEQSYDKDGIIWPLAIAPFAVCITPLSVAPESEVTKLARKYYDELTAQGIEVILDDRDDRPGVKFKDADLIGFPIRIGIGEKSLAKGEVELKLRAGKMEPVKVDEAVERVLQIVANAQS
jgi:prolyl-tRNA synthetase